MVSCLCTHPLSFLPHLIQLSYPELHRLSITAAARFRLIQFSGIFTSHYTYTEAQSREEPVQPHLKTNKQTTQDKLRLQKKRTK